MALKEIPVALAIIAAISPVSAAQVEPSPGQGAPPAPADARYCLRVDPLPDSRIATIRCETREGWARLDVDLDKEWAQEGVRVIAPTPVNT